MDDGGPPEQSRSLHGEGDAAGNRIVPVDPFEVQAIIEEVDEAVRVTLVRAGSSECGASWLTAGKLTGPVGHPGVRPPGWGRVLHELCELGQSEHGRELPQWSYYCRARQL